MSNDQNYSSKNIKQHFEDLEFWSFDVFFLEGRWVEEREGGGCYHLCSFIFISITLEILIILEV